MCEATGDGEILMEYFSSVFTLEKDMKAWEFRDVNSDVFNGTHITEDKVLEVLKCIKVDKSQGPDQMHPRILWEAREKIVAPPSVCICIINNHG